MLFLSLFILNVSLTSFLVYSESTFCCVWSALCPLWPVFCLVLPLLYPFYIAFVPFLHLFLSLLIPNSCFPLFFQVILQNESLCQLCQGPLSSHYMNQPCTEVPSSTHFLFEESQNSTSSPTKPRCVVCSAKNPNREHLANHFVQELIEDLEDETQCSKCQFNAPDCKALVLHEVSKHEGSNLDKVLEDASLVSSKRAEVEARGHRQSLGKQLFVYIFQLFIYICRYFQAIFNIFSRFFTF